VDGVLQDIESALVEEQNRRQRLTEAEEQS
jgi:hypothetical protein